MLMLSRTRFAQEMAGKIPDLAQDTGSCMFERPHNSSGIRTEGVVDEGMVLLVRAKQTRAVRRVFFGVPPFVSICCCKSIRGGDS